MNKKKVYIIGASRTPIGKFGGCLSSQSAKGLGVATLKETIERAKIRPDQIEHVIFGCVLQAGLGQNVARQIALGSGLPYETTAETLNCVCGSGLLSVANGARIIQNNEADVVAVGGTESMSNAPYLLEDARFGMRMGDKPASDCMIKDGLWDVFNNYHMGITAENVCDKWSLTRNELDNFALRSQNRAAEAIEQNKFEEEITPITIFNKEEQIVVKFDECPRGNVDIDKLVRLKPSFKQDGKVTAGNCSPISDGAASLILASEQFIEVNDIKPMAEYKVSAIAGCDPAIMGVAPIFSTDKLLKKCNLQIDDVDLFELNEAFASQSIVVANELGIPGDKLNVNGGAIALGHPIGASGARILVTLIYEMKSRHVRRGLASLCIGGGMGCSVFVEGVL